MFSDHPAGNRDSAGLNLDARSVVLVPLLGGAKLQPARQDFEREYQMARNYRAELIAAWNKQKRLGKKLMAREDLEKYLTAIEQYGSDASSVTPAQMLAAFQSTNFDPDATFSAALDEIRQVAGHDTSMENIVNGDLWAALIPSRQSTATPVRQLALDADDEDNDLCNATGKSIPRNLRQFGKVWDNAGAVSAPSAPDRHPELTAQATFSRRVRNDHPWAESDMFAVGTAFDRLADAFSAGYENAKQVSGETHDDFSAELDPAPLGEVETLFFV